MSYFINATDFLVQSLLGIALFIVLLRFWMQWVRADFRNEIGQFVISLTNPVVIPLRKIIPSVGTIDSATVLLSFIIASIKAYAFITMRGASVDLLTLALFGLGEMLQAGVYVLLIAIIVQIVASWVSPHSYHPVINVARSISEPVMAPARKILPSIGGLDFSPIIVILFLQFFLRLFVAPLLP